MTDSLALLRELNRVKVLFQQRAIAAIILGQESPMPFAPTPNFDERKAYDPSQEQSIDRSYARLCEFRKSWNAGDTIDEESGLTVDDLDTILAHLGGTLS